MKKWLPMIAFIFLSANGILAEKCYDLHLLSGRTIDGVRYRMEEMYGNQYVIYWNLDGAERRVLKTEILHMEEGGCRRATPIPPKSDPSDVVTDPKEFTSSGTGNVRTYLEKLKLRTNGITGHIVQENGLLEIQWNGHKWNLMDYDKKLKLFKDLSESWTESRKKDGLGNGQVIVVETKSNQTLAEYGLLGWTINSAK